MNFEYSLSLDAITGDSTSPGRQLFEQWKRGVPNLRVIRGGFLEGVFFELLISNLRQKSSRSSIEVRRDDLDPYVKLTLLIQEGNLLAAQRWRREMLSEAVK